VDIASLLISIFIPILISLVAYFGHNYLQSIEQEIKTLKKTTSELNQQSNKLERMVEAASAENRIMTRDLDLKVSSFKTEVLETKADLKASEIKQLHNTETQGKILLILNKVVAELKKKSP